MTKHIKKIPGQALHYLPASDYHPANTYFHFSFANYYNPDNMNFGALRVLNDDDVKPHSGFGKHPHQDMEIVSYLVHGQLTHWDSATDVEDVIGRGQVQTVTAGNGVWHSELNQHDEWCCFLQIWIMPPAQGLPVRYENHKFEASERENKLLHIVGNEHNRGDAPLYLHQDVNMYVPEINDPDAQVTFNVDAGRQVYMNNFEGEVYLEGVDSLKERDSAEIIGPCELKLSVKSDKPCHFILIEVAAD